MTNSYCVSVIVPYYNSSSTIVETLNSIIGQHDITLEVLVIDDGSSVHERKMLQIISKDYPTVKFIYLDENKGVANARNIGIDRSKYDIIAFCDSDDLWLPEKLKLQLDNVSQDFFSCTECVYVDETGAILGSSPVYEGEINLQRILKTNDIICSSVVLSKSVLGKSRFPMLEKRQDHALWIELIAKGQNVTKINIPLLKYRVQKSSLSGNKYSAMGWSYYLLRSHLNFNFFKSCYYFINYLIIGFRKQLHRK